MVEISEDTLKRIVADADGSSQYTLSEKTKDDLKNILFDFNIIESINDYSKEQIKGIQGLHIQKALFVDRYCSEPFKKKYAKLINMIQRPYISKDRKSRQEIRDMFIGGNEEKSGLDGMIERLKNNQK